MTDPVGKLPIRPTGEAGSGDEPLEEVIPEMSADDLAELIDNLDPIPSSVKPEDASVSHYDLEIWDSEPPSLPLAVIEEPPPAVREDPPAIPALRAAPPSSPGLDGDTSSSPRRAPDDTYRSMPGAPIPSPRRDDPEFGFLPPVAEGPLALLVLDDFADAWALEAPLTRMGWRTSVRLGGDEALHAIHEEMPDLVVLKAWGHGGEGLTFLRVSKRFFPDVEKRVIAVGCGGRGGGLHDVLMTEGVRAFIEGQSTPLALETLLGHLGVQTEPGESSHTASVLDQLTAALTVGESPESTSLGLLPGTLIGDRFVVEQAIGRGTTATVYRVRDLLLQVRVALKVLSLSAAMDNALERFRREMLVCRELIHPNVVRTYDFGVTRGQPFYTMELLQGRTLDAYCGVDGSKPWSERPNLAQRINLMVQAFSGLDAVHKAGILHRDIKSDNVFVLDQTAQVKLVDFGVAKFEGAQVAISAEGIVLGTPTYLAPEILLNGEPASRATDIYGMGVVAWEILVGQMPWESPDLANLMAAIAVQAPPVPRTLQPELTRDASDLLLQLIDRQPGRRPPTARSVAVRLDREAKKLGWRDEDSRS
ncbi:MAG: protein kinase [Deltaproteobacteria bacterium]|nr:protein kinase [Deltaproteobacteria bacterium]